MHTHINLGNDTQYPWLIVFNQNKCRTYVLSQRPFYNDYVQEGIRKIAYLHFFSWSRLPLTQTYSSLSPHFASFSIFVSVSYLFYKLATSPSLDGMTLCRCPVGLWSINPAWPPEPGAQGLLLVWAVVYSRNFQSLTGGCYLLLS